MPEDKVGREPHGEAWLSLVGMAETLRISVPTVIDAFLGRADRRRCDARLRDWSRRLMEMAEITVDVRGALDPVRGSETFVVMSNHQSTFDIPVIYSVFPGTLRMVAKRELFWIPIWGRALRDSEFIPIERGSRHGATESMELARRRLERRVHVWIAPEGTRSRDGRLLPFKTGAFRLAIATGHRVLPLTVDGTQRVMPRAAWTVRRGQSVTLHVHPPVDPRSFDLGPNDASLPARDPRLEAFMSAVRKEIAGPLEARVA